MKTPKQTFSLSDTHPPQRRRLIPTVPFLLTLPKRLLRLINRDSFPQDSIARKIRFNENFGIGARFIAGEEDIFIYDALRAGLSPDATSRLT